MAWLKYSDKGIVNLDKIVNIHVREADTYRWAIYLHDDGNNTYRSKIYSSWDECMKDFNVLMEYLEDGAQFIDMTNLL
jgi:hypothetical protein